ncbi:hypothetical protein D3C78_1927660 [compost metagenome]
MATSQGNWRLASAITAGMSVIWVMSSSPPNANDSVKPRAISRAQPRFSTIASRKPCRSRRPMARPTMASTA